MYLCIYRTERERDLILGMHGHLLLGTGVIVNFFLKTAHGISYYSYCPFNWLEFPVTLLPAFFICVLNQLNVLTAE